MDVVKQNIESMRGVVSVESTIGKGTIFKIKLPLTTAIIDGLIVRVGEDKFIIPTHTVQVTLRPKAKQLTRIANQREMINKQEVVIKPLGDIVGELQGIAGGAILGDGSIALILDPAALVQQDVA